MSLDLYYVAIRWSGRRHVVATFLFPLVLVCMHEHCSPATLPRFKVRARTRRRGRSEVPMVPYLFFPSSLRLLPEKGKRGVGILSALACQRGHRKWSDVETTGEPSIRHRRIPRQLLLMLAVYCTHPTFVPVPTEVRSTLPSLRAGDELPAAKAKRRKETKRGGHPGHARHPNHRRRRRRSFWCTVPSRAVLWNLHTE